MVEKQKELSKTTFFAGSLAVFSSGMLFGVYRVLKQEKGTIKGNMTPLMVACKALAWGTVLCLGTFAGAGAAFSYATNVTTIKEFDVWAKAAGKKLNLPVPKVDAKEQEESEEIEKQLTMFFDSLWVTKSEDDSTRNSSSVK